MSIIDPYWPSCARRGAPAAARVVVTASLAGAVVLFGAAAAEAVADRAFLLVNTTEEAAVDGLCSLREAVLAANTNQRVDGCRAGGLVDVISLPAGTYTMTQGELVFERSTVLRGYAAVVRRPDAHVEPYWREAVVRVAPTADVVLAGVTIDGAGRLCAGLVNEGMLRMVDGSLTGTEFGAPSGCIHIPGAALNNRGTATLSRTSIVNNAADLYASAFMNYGTLHIVDGLISGNSSRPFQRFGVTYVSQNHGSLSVEGTSYRNNAGVALHNSGKLSVRNSSFQRGTAVALWNDGDASVTRTSFTQNASGIRNSGSLQIAYSRIEGNLNVGFGGPLVGGIQSSGTLLMERSSVTGNQGAGAGGIAADGEITVRDSTIAGNVGTAWTTPGSTRVNVDGAGGVVTNGTAHFTNLTLADNRYEVSLDAPSPLHFAGGLYVAAGSVSMANSVVALNQHNQLVEGNGLDCTGQVSSLGHNFLQSTLGCAFTPAVGDRLDGGDPLLSALGRHGGYTLTMVPRPDSPLVDRGSPTTVGSDAADACSRHDQLRRHRPRDGDGDGVAVCDIGAVERRSSRAS